MAEFPQEELEILAIELDAEKMRGSDIIRLAIQRQEELSDRCVMDRAHASARIGHLRARLAILDPQGEPL